MKGQLSLELLLIFLIMVLLLSAMYPAIAKSKEIINKGINIGNAKLILDKISTACDRVLIGGSGAVERMAVLALADYNFHSSGSKLTATVYGEQIFKQSACAPSDFVLEKGKNEVEVRFESGHAVLYPNA